MHTKNVEWVWGLGTWFNMESCFAEFMWQNQLSNIDPYSAILEAVKQYWLLETEI